MILTDTFKVLKKIKNLKSIIYWVLMKLKKKIVLKDNFCEQSITNKKQWFRYFKINKNFINTKGQIIF